MNDTIHTLPAVLTFAATDPTSGAGLQADLLALASMGCYPLSVVTALTVQDTAGVESVFPIDPDWVAEQARCILEDMPVAAFKMGMLGSTEIVTVVAEVVSDYPDVPLVLDPVFASGRGDEFAGEDMVAAIRELLVPQSTVVTPNIPELKRLAGEDENDNADLAECAQALLDSGCEYVLVTGTHDTRAPYVQTIAFYKVLLDYGKDVKLLVYPGMGHGPRTLTGYESIFGYVTGWFAAHGGLALPDALAPR